MTDFMVGDVVRVPGLREKHIEQLADLQQNAMWSPVHTVVSRLIGSEARIMEMGLPYGIRGTRTGVRVLFQYAVPRRLPPEVGDGWETGPDGEWVYDARTAVALVTVTMLRPSAAELSLAWQLRRENP